MARFFGGRKNQAENDFRRFEQEVYLNSTPRPPQPSDRILMEEDDDQFYAQTNFNNRGYPPSLRPEQYQQQQSSRQQPTFSTKPPLEASADSLGQMRPLRQNEYAQSGYNQNSYKKTPRADELKGLRFWQDDQEETNDDSEEWVERPSPFKFIVALIGLTAMVAILWFGYSWLSQPGSDSPVLIEAEPGPFKVKPENPGGTEIPYQDKLIYGRISPGTEAPVERLLPPPEQPMAPPPPPPSAEHESSAQQQPYNPQPQQYSAQGYHPSGAPLPPPPPSYPHPGGYPGQPAGAYPAQAGGQQSYYPPAHPNAASQPQDGQQYNSTQPGQPAYANPQYPAQPPQQAQPRPVTPIAPQAPAEGVTKESTPVVKAGPGSGFYIQLGTLPTEAAAKEELKRLRKKHRAELTDYEDRTEVFETADGKKIYRALIGPFQKRNAALSKCNRLGSTCRVIQVP